MLSIHETVETMYSNIPSINVGVLVVVGIYTIMFAYVGHMCYQLVSTGRTEFDDVESDEIVLIYNKRDAGECTVDELEEEDEETHPSNEEEDKNTKHASSDDEDKYVD